jgi:DNA-binding MarR family transcriptional regulator
MDRTTLTRNLEPLVRQGLVEIVPGQDRRQRVARLTPGGEAAWERAWSYWRLAQTALAGEVGQSEIELLHTQLDSVTRGAERLGAPVDGDDPPPVA